MAEGVQQGRLKAEECSLLSRILNVGGSMPVTVMRVEANGSLYRLAGSWRDLDAANAFLTHLSARAFSPQTIRAYAYDILNFESFLTEKGLRLGDVVPLDLFDWLEWQASRSRPGTGNVVHFTKHAGAAPATINRRVAAVRALFEHQVMLGQRPDNPVPAPRRGQGLRSKSSGVLGHLGPRASARRWSPRARAATITRGS